MNRAQIETIHSAILQATGLHFCRFELIECKKLIRADVLDYSTSEVSLSVTHVKGTQVFTVFLLPFPDPWQSG